MAETRVLACAPALAGPVIPPTVSVTVAPPACRLVLRGDAAVARRAGEAFGTLLPLSPCRATEAAGRAALWLGPDEWLLLAGGVEPAEEVARLEAALQAEPHSLVDVSHRQIGLRIAGARAARLLSSGCPLDLDLRAFPAGMAVRTVFAKAEIVLWRPSADTFHVEVWRSFADYLVGWLAEAARGLPDV